VNGKKRIFCRRTVKKIFLNYTDNFWAQLQETESRCEVTSEES